MSPYFLKKNLLKYEKCVIPPEMKDKNLPKENKNRAVWSKQFSTCVQKYFAFATVCPSEKRLWVY